MTTQGPGRENKLTLDSDTINTIQAVCIENYTKIAQTPYEHGTCKKVMELSSKLGDNKYKNLALATTIEISPNSEIIIKNEHVQLKWLKQKGFPIVELHGDVFLVQEIKRNGVTEKRYGMLMDYIPNATFIEAKTPAPLKKLIYACLLDLNVRYQESWFFHEKTITNSIVEEIQKKPEVLRERAQKLGKQYESLLKKMVDERIWISDLQILLTSDGSLTIIDPLDVGVVSAENKLISEIDPQRESGAQFIQSIEDTMNWLKKGQEICNHIVQAKNSVSLARVFLADQLQTSYTPGFHTNPQSFRSVCTRRMNPNRKSNRAVKRDDGMKPK